MDKTYIFEENQLRSFAFTRFSQICGLEKCDGQVASVIEGEAQRIYRKYFCVRRVKGVVRRFGKSVWRNKRVYAEDREISCSLFARIPEDIVEGVYFYALTAGALFAEGSDDARNGEAAMNPMEQLYLDIWGTAFLDSGRIFLEQTLLAEENHQNENPLFLWGTGPGFYDMDLEECSAFVSVLKPDRIGVDLNESGVLRPEKSCIGLYLLLNRPFFSDMACRTCRGSSSGCSFCQLIEGRNTG